MDINKKLPCNALPGSFFSLSKFIDAVYSK